MEIPFSSFLLNLKGTATVNHLLNAEYHYHLPSLSGTSTALAVYYQVITGFLSASDRDNKWSRFTFIGRLWLEETASNSECAGNAGLGSVWMWNPRVGELTASHETSSDQRPDRWRLFPTHLVQRRPSRGQGWYPPTAPRGEGTRADPWHTLASHSHTLRCWVLSAPVSLSGVLRERTSPWLWQFHHPHSRSCSSVARSSPQPGCVSNWHSNWQIWMPPLDG